MSHSFSSWFSSHLTENNCAIIQHLLVQGVRFLPRISTIKIYFSCGKSSSESLHSFACISPTKAQLRSCIESFSPFTVRIFFKEARAFMLQILFISTLLLPPPPFVLSHTRSRQISNLNWSRFKFHKFVYFRKIFRETNAHLNAFDIELKIFPFWCRCFA